MLHMARLAGFAVLAAAAIGVVGCSHSDYGTAYGPDGYYGDGYYYGPDYHDGYYYGHRYRDYDRDRYGYHIQREHEGYDGYRGEGRHDISRDINRGGEREGISRDMGSGGSRGMERGGRSDGGFSGGGHGGGHR